MGEVEILRDGSMKGGPCDPGEEVGASGCRVGRFVVGQDPSFSKPFFAAFSAAGTVVAVVVFAAGVGDAAVVVSVSPVVAVVAATLFDAVVL